MSTWRLHCKGCDRVMTRTGVTVETARVTVCDKCNQRMELLNDPANEPSKVEKEWRQVERVQITEDQYDRSQALLRGEKVKVNP